MASAEKHVLILQPRIQHYRLPVFDRLQQLADGQYRISIRGTLHNGAAIGGGERSYYVDSRLRRMRCGTRRIEWWPKTLNYVRHRCPSAVVTSLYPSNMSTWRLPTVCRQLGISCIGWSKVHGQTSLPLVRRFKKRLFAKYDFMLVYGALSRDELINMEYPSERIFVARNTIDTEGIIEKRDQFAAAAIRLRRKYRLEDRLLVLCIAKFEPQKRHQDLLAAWQRIRQLDPRLCLVLIGSGSHESAVRRQVERMQDGRIHLLGRVPAGQDYDWIAAADLNIQCGAVGLAINQSMAMGVPTIIADERGADTEALRHGVTGWRYPRGDIETLVSVVHQVLCDRSSRDKIIASAHHVIRNHFTIGQMVAAIHRCILSALNLSGDPN